MNLLLYETPEELAEAAARDFATRAQEAIYERGRFAVALAGGSTPKATYEVLARDYANELDWSRVHVHSGTSGPSPRPRGLELPDGLRDPPLARPGRERPQDARRAAPDEAAAAYEEELRAFFGQVDVPRFDLILCGLGEDGHTLSLFPETAALDVNDRWVVANPVLKLGTTRLTLTIPVLNASRAVTFLVAGESKAEALKEVLEGDADPRAYPAKLVRPESRDLTWMVDRAAARSLKPPL